MLRRKIIILCRKLMVNGCSFRVSVVGSVVANFESPGIVVVVHTAGVG